MLRAHLGSRAVEQNAAFQRNYRFEVIADVGFVFQIAQVYQR